MNALFRLIQTHWLAIILVAAGTWLRFTQLPEKGILTANQGRELLAAAGAVHSGHWFPPHLSVTTWLDMGIYKLVGYWPTGYYWAFAGLGSLGLIAVYEFCLVWVNRQVGVLALAVVSFCPWLIATSRMPNALALLPFLIVVGLWSLAWIWQRSGKKMQLLFLLKRPLPQRSVVMGGLVIAGLSVISVLMVYRCNFFVDTTARWSTGPSLGTQKQILQWAAQDDRYATVGIVGPSNIDSYIWIGQVLYLQVVPESAPHSLTIAIANQDTITDTQPFIFTGFHAAKTGPKILSVAGTTARRLP